MAFCLVVFHHEVTVKLGKNHHFGNQDEVPDSELVKQTLKLFDYAMRIRSKDETWDLSLPNPALYPEGLQEVIEKVNAICINAMKYVIGHEFSHIELNHTQPTAPMTREESLALSIKEEKEADARSIELVLKGRSSTNKDTIELGILVGLLSILMLQENTKSEGYPDADDRLGNYLENLGIDEKHHLWAVAVQGYKLWDITYNKNLKWPEDSSDYRALYFAIRAQLKKSS